MDIPLKKDHFELYCCPQGIEAYWKRLPDYMQKKAKTGLRLPELISWATHSERYWIHLAARKTYPDEYRKFYATHPMLDLWECGTLEDLILDVDEHNTLLNMRNMTVRGCEFYCEGRAVFMAHNAYANDTLFSGRFELRSNNGIFKDCGFEGRITYPTIYEASLYKCVFNHELLFGTFERSKLRSCTFADIEIKDMDFKDVHFDRGCKFKNVKFVDCIFKNCTFSSCQFDGVVLKDCMNSGCKFENCKDIFARDTASMV